MLKNLYMITQIKKCLSLRTRKWFNTGVAIPVFKNEIAAS